MLANSKKTSFQECLFDVFFMALFVGVFYAIWIGAHALFTPDEGRYSEIAREMVVTGDYITPRLNGVVFLDKPILYYWLQASAIHLFGLKEWSLRFWPALLGVFGCVMTYVTGRVLFNRRTGILSALVLASSPLYYGGAHYANLDLEVAVLISTAIMFALMSIHTGRTPLLLLSYAFAGLAFLTKGLIGIFFPGAIIGTGILILKRWNFFKNLHLLAGISIFAAITVPWYVLAQNANPQFLHFFFIDQQVSRFLTNGTYNNQAALWFYLPIVIAGCFPWAIFIFGAMSQKIKNAWNHRQQHANELFLLLWVLFVFTFFSIPKSKTVGYILPIFPAIALLIGHYLNTIWDNKSKIVMMIYSVLTVVIFIAAIIVPKITDNSADLIFYIHIAGAIFLVSGILAFCFRHKNISTQFFCLLATAVAFSLLISASTQAVNQKSLKPLTVLIKPELRADDEVVAYYKYYQDLPIYLEKRITIVADWDATDIPQKDNLVRELLYGIPFQNTKDWLINQDVFWKKWNSDKRLFVFLNSGYLQEFTDRANSKMIVIGRHNNVLLVTNHQNPTSLPANISVDVSLR